MAERVSLTVLWHGPELVMHERHHETELGLERFYSFFGGKVLDSDMTAAAAATRKLKEDLGIDYIRPAELGKPVIVTDEELIGFVFGSLLPFGTKLEPRLDNIRNMAVTFSPVEVARRSDRLMPLTRKYVEEHF